MGQKDLLYILRKTAYLFIISLFSFIILANLLKVIQYVVEVDNVVRSAIHSDDSSIEMIESDIIPEGIDKTENYDFNKAHTAKAIGYRESISDLNESYHSDGINILLIGADKRNFTENKSRSDVIIVLKVTDSGKIFSMSIPRDTLVKVNAGRHGFVDDKIGHSMYWGSTEVKKSCFALNLFFFKTIIIFKKSLFVISVWIIFRNVLKKNVEAIILPSPDKSHNLIRELFKKTCCLLHLSISPNLNCLFLIH